MSYKRYPLALTAVLLCVNVLCMVSLKEEPDEDQTQ